MKTSLRLLTTTALAIQFLVPTFAFAESTGSDQATRQFVQNLSVRFPSTDKNQWAKLLSELAQMTPADRRMKLDEITEAEAKLKTVYDEQRRIYDLARQQFAEDGSHPLRTILVPTAVAFTSAVLALKAKSNAAMAVYSIAFVAAGGFALWSANQESITKMELQDRQTQLDVLTRALESESEFVHLAKQFNAVSQ